MSASISPTELAEMEVDAAQGDLKAFDGIRLLAEVRRLRDSIALALENSVASSCGFCRETYMILKRTER